MRARTFVTDRHRVAAFHTSQVVFATVPLLLAVFFIVGERVDWDVLVIGLAWRGWLLLYTLPFLIAAAGGGSGGLTLLCHLLPRQFFLAESAGVQGVRVVERRRCRIVFQGL